MDNNTQKWIDLIIWSPQEGKEMKKNIMYNAIQVKGKDINISYQGSFPKIF